MAYVTKYRFNYTNELQEEILILLQQKDGEEGLLQEYAAVKVKHTVDGKEGKDACLCGSSMDVEFDIRPDEVDYWESLVNATKDEWKMVARMGTFTIFEGFVINDEGVVPFLDRPYNARISAVDGIGLLRDLDFIQPNQTNFNGINKIIWYIAAALQQTGLVLPIRVYDNVYHKSMLNRDDDYKHDFFSQAYLEYRTFLRDATNFTKAYDALETILKENYRLFYWNGQWVIIRISLFQYWPFARYYTLYDYNGANAVGHEETENYATVGKAELIYPVHENQLKYTKKAVKSVRTTFNYEPWPEIPKNSKFERGVPILALSGIEHDTDDIDDDNDTNEVIGARTATTVGDWEFGEVTRGVGGFPVFPFNLTPVPQQAYIKKVTSPYGVELFRHVVVPTAPGQNSEYWLRSEGIPVVEGYKVSFSVDVSFANNMNAGSTSGSFSRPVIIYIVTPTGIYYGLDRRGVWKKNDTNELAVDYNVGDDTRDWFSSSVESNSIPASGMLYIVFNASGSGNPGVYIRYKSFSFSLKPFISGGYLEVKGEYWLRSQNVDYPDVSEKEVRIADTGHKIFKGCLLNANGVPFTREWYRMGLTESRHFNELTNLGWYNHEYRRFQLIEGFFTSLKFVPNNNIEHYQPLGLHKQYRFADLPNEDRRFMLNVPLEMDIDKGEFDGRFHEVLLASEQTVRQKESIERLVGRIRYAIDSTTADEWNSAGQAPTPGTLGFPPQTAQFNILSDKPYQFTVFASLGEEMTVSVQGGTVINRTVTPNWNGVTATNFSIDTNTFQVGDILTFSAYGHQLVFTVEEVEVSVSPDGEQLGDYAEFKYNFG